MDGYLGSFGKLAGAVKSRPQGAEDYFDRLNYVMTPALLLAVATIVGMKQYVFQPIQCWSVQEFDSHRMQYAENYCWVENTFHFEDDTPLPHSNPGEGKTIHYYQWVPFILMAQAALFHVPHLLWLLFSTHTGVDIKQLASQARKVEAETNEDEKAKKIRFLSTSLLRFIRFRSRYRQENPCRRFVSFLLGKPSFAMYFVFSYLVVKTCYIANCVGQLHLMRSFLGLNMTSFGFQIFNDILENRTWQTTHVFPRVTYCQMNVLYLGKTNDFTLQCVLPVNMLNEKFYILIWFWIVILLVFNIFSALRCLLKLLLSPSRRRMVKKYLKIAEVVDGQNFRRQPSKEKDFVDGFLKTDGAFLLSVISRNAGDIVTADVVTDCFSAWEKDRKALGDSSSIDASVDGKLGVSV